MERRAWESLTETEQHIHLVRETARRVGEGLSVSNRSAADLWGIPYLGDRPGKVEVTAKRAGGGRQSSNLRYHTTARPPDPIDLDGVPVTSPARTAVDIARTLGFASGLMAFDHVVAKELASVEDLAAAIAGLPRRLDRARAECALVRLDARSESPAESLARARMYQIGAPIPDLQRTFHLDGTFIGRTDFYWEDADCIGEMDGDVKYLGGNGEKPAAEVLIREKRREDSLRRLVKAFIRFTWNDARANRLRPARIRSPSPGCATSRRRHPRD